MVYNILILTSSFVIPSLESSLRFTMDVDRSDSATITDYYEISSDMDDFDDSTIFDSLEGLDIMGNRKRGRDDPRDGRVNARTRVHGDAYDVLFSNPTGTLEELAYGRLELQEDLRKLLLLRMINVDIVDFVNAISTTTDFGQVYYQIEQQFGGNVPNNIDLFLKYCWDGKQFFCDQKELIGSGVIVYVMPFHIWEICVYSEPLDRFLMAINDAYGILEK